jgi:L-asparaginase
MMINFKVFTTGGSIDKFYSTQTSEFEIGDPQIHAILDQANVAVDYEIEPLIKKDSLQLTDRDRDEIHDMVKSDPHRRILITHGTDTMIDTALALLDIPGKVIVITGAMQPAAFRETDAHFNIGSAVIALQTLPEGVYVVMNGRVLDPRLSKKNQQMDRFEELSGVVKHD